MKTSLRLVIACALAGVAGSLLPAEDLKPATKEDGFKPMFNGRDLTGWVNVNCHPDTFFVKGDEIITTGKPTGFLRTEKQYENFVLEMDWMHVNKTEVGNSGLFVWGDPLPGVGTPYTRGIEVQVLVNLEYKNKDGKVTASSHGDLFSIHGAKCVPDRPHPNGSERCLPSENRAKGGGEWNHYKVTANDGVIKLEVNGKEVSGVSKCNPRKGYLALESEGAECHFKNLKIKELPSTNPKPEECAKVWEGHVSLFNGIDLKGWKTAEGAWKVGGGTLKSAGKADLVSEKKYENYEVIFDWKLPAKANTIPSVGVHDKNGEVSFYWYRIKLEDVAKDPEVKAGGWQRTAVVSEGKELRVSLNGKQVKVHKFDKPLTLAPVMFQPFEGLEIMNVFVRELKEEKK